MRLCAALAVVLVASLVFAFEVMHRPRRRAPATSPDAAEIAAPRSAPFRLPARLPAGATRPPSPASISGHVHVAEGADTVRVVATPSGGTEAEARAVIHVAVGFPRGERCPIDKLLLGWIEGGSPWVKGIPVYNNDCRFEISAPPRGGRAKVIAEGGVLSFSAEIIIPEHGDPEPICLNPPCRANPLEGQAQLRVTLEGVDARSPISATVAPIDDSDERWGCGSSLFTCTVDAVPAGRTYAITASGDDCDGGPVFAAIAEGENAVSVPCVRDSQEDESPPDRPDDLDS